MIRKYRLLLIILLITMTFVNMEGTVKADSINSLEGKNILIIASYTYNNRWENNIIKGLKEYYDENLIRIEYLDSAAFESKNYYSDFLDLLNIKYISNDIDYIITLDDEAFDFVLTYLFDKDAVFYKKTIFCLGLNTVFNITDEQKKYVCGIIDTQNGEEFLKFIKETSPKVHDIYLLLDESAYCEAFSKSVTAGNKLINSNFNIHYIKSNYMEKVCNSIKNVDLKSSALILAGTFYSSETGYEVDEHTTVESIQTLTDTVLYTTLEGYVEEGALGGLINNGYNLGKSGAEQLENIIENNMNYYTFSIVSDLFDMCQINYKAMRKYKVNPFNLPNNTVYLEKEKYDLLFPEGMITLFKFIVSTVIILIIILFLLMINHKKKAYETKIRLSASEEREKIKTDYIILLSHELRTPLNIIINTAKLLKIKSEKENCEKDYLLIKVDSIINNSNRLLKSINNSIDLAKIEANVFDTNFTMENIVEVIDEVIDATADLVKTYNCEIIFDPQEEVIETAVDKEKIIRILLNLISNSVKNVYDEGNIFITCSKDMSHVYISVIDNGIGISENDKNHIFDKFFQSSSNITNRLNEGSGVGLYITKKLIEMHDGNIEVESSLGLGTTFNIKFPIKIVDEEAKEKESVNRNVNEIAFLEFSDVMHKNNVK